MKHTVYILYSKRIDSYYVGQTIDFDERLKEHNSQHYDNSYTKNGIPWAEFYTITCESREQAIKIQSHIKRMKSRKYYFSLITYPEISKKLLSMYS